MMNKLAVVISVVLVVGLAGCTEDAAKKRCSADCNGQLTQTSCPYYGAQYTGGTMGCNTTTCTLDDSQCETGTTVGEFEYCTATNVQCDTDLVCEDFSLLLGDSVCTTACTGAGDCSHLTDGYCENTWEATVYRLAPFCFEQSGRYGFCFSDLGCSEAGNACMALTGVSPECLLACDGGDVGATGTCGTETCLPSQYVECEQTGTLEGDPYCVEATRVSCTMPDDSPCTDAANYECVTIKDEENGGTFDACARAVGVCGVEGIVQYDGSDAGVEAAVEAGLDDIDPQPTLCDIPWLNTFCGDDLGDSSATAELSCTSTGWALRSDVGCASDLDCFQDGNAGGAGGECMSFSGGSTLCAVSLNLCVAFCETVDGSAGLTCPSSHSTCAIPEHTFGFPIVEGGQTPVACTEVGVQDNCSSDFICTSFGDGNYCARNRKICT